MLDIQLFRADKGGNPDLVRESQRRRCKDPAIVDQVIEKDNEFRAAQSNTDKAKQASNLCSKAVGEKKKAKEADGEDLPIPEEITTKLKAFQLDLADLRPLSILQLKSLSTQATEYGNQLAAKADEIEKERDVLLASVGNIVHESVRATKDEDENEVVRKWGCDGLKEERNGKPNHVDVMKRLGMDTSENVTRLAGNRAYFLKGPLAQLHMAVINYAIQYLTAKGYTPIYPPFFLNQSAMSEVAELADFDDQLYKLTGDGGDKYLIATSEQPICAYHAQQYYSDKDLPIKYAGYSTCFRKEVGSHGRDTLGIFRVHQFDKIEQFVVTSPEENKSWETMEDMIANAEGFYQSLGLPYRVVKIVAGALNGAAAMKYDLEGWFPSSGAFRELVSCSNCTDYQSRAIGARYGTGKSKAGTGAQKTFVHMLNSTMCAATRVMCLICETFQTDEGIAVPEVLRPYVGGQTVLKYTDLKTEQK